MPPFSNANSFSPEISSNRAINQFGVNINSEALSFRPFPGSAMIEQHNLPLGISNPVLYQSRYQNMSYQNISLMNQLAQVPFSMLFPTSSSGISSTNIFPISSISASSISPLSTSILSTSSLSNSSVCHSPQISETLEQYSSIVPPTSEISPSIMAGTMANSIKNEHSTSYSEKDISLKPMMSSKIRKEENDEEFIEKYEKRPISTNKNRNNDNCSTISGGNSAKSIPKEIPVTFKEHFKRESNFINSNQKSNGLNISTRIHDHTIAVQKLSNNKREVNVRSPLMPDNKRITTSMSKNNIKITTNNNENDKIRKLSYKEGSIEKTGLSDCLCKGEVKQVEIIKCIECNRNFHETCLNVVLPPKEYICPLCKLYAIDPLDNVITTIFENIISKITEIPFEKTVNLLEVESIQEARKDVITLKRPMLSSMLGNCYDIKLTQEEKIELENKYDLQLRCLRLTLAGPPEIISFPDECEICVNGEVVEKKEALKLHISTKVRKDCSCNLLSFVLSKYNLISPISINVRIKKLAEVEAKEKRIKNEYPFVFGLYFVEKLSQDQLFERLIKRPIYCDDNFLQSFMNNGEVEMEKIVLRPEDCRSWKIMEWPVRGNKCKHTQCFDLYTQILLMKQQDRSRAWKCPLCNEFCQQMVIDKYFKKLIKICNELDFECDEIILEKCGNIVFQSKDDKFHMISAESHILKDNEPSETKESN